MGWGGRCWTRCALTTAVAARLYCELTWGESHDQGMPIQVFVGSTVRFRVECRQCPAHSDHTAEQIIAGLVRSGRGDGSTSVRSLPATLTRVCRCGQRIWTVDLRLPAQSGVGPSYLPKVERTRKP